MKVVFLFGGLPHYYNLILNKLNRIAGLDIEVIVPSEKGYTIGAGVHESADSIEFKVHKLEEYKTFYGKYFFRGLKNQLELIKPDIVVVSYSYGLGFLFDLKLKKYLKQNNIKLIFKTIPFGEPYYNDAVDHYTKIWNDKGKSFIFKPLLSRFLSVLFVAANKRLFNMVDAHVNYIDEAIDIYSSYGVEKSKIFITYNSPDTEEIDKHRAEVLKLPKLYNSAEIQLLHIGRLVKWKRVDLLIEAFASLLPDYGQLRLKIVGNGPELEALQQLAIDLKVSNYVDFIGAVYDPIELGRIMHSCDLYVLAGIGGLSINEAMIYSLPVICSVADGTEKKLVRNGFNGFRIEPDNLDELKKAISKIVENESLRVDMGKNSRQIIETEVNEKVVLKGYLQAFNHLMKNTNLELKEKQI